MSKISVIVPVYNVKEYLEECISSVIQQTHKDFELLLIDDGSNDGSSDICKQYQERYPDIIKAIFLQNGGPLRARLIGVRKSSGDILVFLDSDDCLRKDALSQIKTCFEVNCCDMVLYDAGVSEVFFSRPILHSLPIGSIFDTDHKSELYKKILKGEIPNSVCLKAIRREFAYFPEYFTDLTLRHGEDLLLSANFITNCQKIVYLNEGLYYYRDRPGSAIHSFNRERKESVKVVHTELEKIVDQWSIPELKQVHAARKVRGWMDQLKLLLKNRKILLKQEFKSELISMAEDPYFRNAYEEMDQMILSQADRKLARYLYKKQYFWILELYIIKVVLSKANFRRIYGK